LDLFKEVLTVFLAAVPAAWMPIHIKRPSQLLYWVLYVLVVVPIVYIVPHAVKLEFADLITLQTVVLFSFAVLGGFYLIRLVDFSLPRLTDGYFLASIFTISGIFLAVIGWKFGFKLRVFNIADIYQVRGEYKEALAEGGRWTAYFLGWQGNVLNPLLMGYGLACRRYLLMLVGLFLQLFLFALTGYKTLLLSGVLIVVVYFLTRRKSNHFGLKISWAFSSLVALCLVFDQLFGFVYFSSILVRRLIVTPGLLMGYYFDFFSNNPKVLLSHSIFQSLKIYPYSLNPAQLIGDVYFGAPEMSANANIWADGFANFGLIGILGVSIVLGLVLFLYDSVTQKVELPVACALLAVPAITLANSALLTCLLTHGLGFAVLVALIVPRSSDPLSDWYCGPIHR